MTIFPQMNCEQKMMTALQWLAMAVSSIKFIGLSSKILSVLDNKVEIGKICCPL